MMFREDLRLKQLDILADDVFLLGVTEDFTQTHIALVDDTKTLLLSADVNARSTILSVTVDIAVLVCSSCTIKLKIDS
jgi:hypothetical protein